MACTVFKVFFKFFEAALQQDAWLSLHRFILSKKYYNYIGIQTIVIIWKPKCRLNLHMQLSQALYTFLTSSPLRIPRVTQVERRRSTVVDTKIEFLKLHACSLPPIMHVVIYAITSFADLHAL